MSARLSHSVIAYREHIHRDRLPAHCGGPPPEFVWQSSEPRPAIALSDRPDQHIAWRAEHLRSEPDGALTDALAQELSVA